MPKVSFILPAYKRRFLKEAIDSILSQTCRDFELVVVDDKSPEGLYEIIREYPWEPLFAPLSDGGKRWVVDGIPVRYYQNKTNIGGKNLVAAWNHAMEYATGEWCVLASDDDVYLPEFLEEMLCLQRKYPICDLFHCRICGINGKGDINWIGDPRAEWENGIQMLYHATVRRIAQRIGDLMFRKTALKALGGFPYNPSAWYTDLMTAVILAQKNGAVCASKILFLFRESGENISTRVDDIEIKIEAGLQFKDWIWKRIDGVVPQSNEDAVLLSEVCKMEDARIYDTMRFYLSKLSFFKMISVVHSSRLARVIKLQFIKSRLSNWLNLRNYLPF